MAFKILQGKLILEPSMIPKMQFQRPMRECNQTKVDPNNKLIEPYYRLDVAGSTFFYATPKLWNQSISPLQANAPSVEAFKSHFRK